MEFGDKLDDKVVDYRVPLVSPDTKPDPSPEEQAQYWEEVLPQVWVPIRKENP